MAHEGHGQVLDDKLLRCTPFCLMFEEADYRRCGGFLDNPHMCTTIVRHALLIAETAVLHTVI